MIQTGEPVLKPFLFAMALIYLALISQPVWSKKPDNPGPVAQPEHAVDVDANGTKSAVAEYGYHTP
jgi:hypothetical protein